MSTDVLAAETIRFDPPLPEKVEAAARLPLGLANKVFLWLDAPDELPADGHLIGCPERAGTGAYHLRPFGRPVVEGYFGGSLARDLEEAGGEAARRLRPRRTGGAARRTSAAGRASSSRPRGAGSR